jgi:hypothetical protein
MDASPSYVPGEPMTAFAISVLAGASLALRFKVFVLGPVMILAAAASIAAGV